MELIDCAYNHPDKHEWIPAFIAQPTEFGTFLLCSVSGNFFIANHKDVIAFLSTKLGTPFTNFFELLGMHNP
jgi:hypothetical protein